VECMRRGYWNNKFEVEARAFADTHHHRLHQMLRGSAQQRLAVVQPASYEDQQGAHREGGTD
jgi:hypothetical protein